MVQENTYEPMKKVSIIVSQNSIENVYPGLILANGALMEGMDAVLFFTFFGVDAVTKNKMNNLQVKDVQNFMSRMPAPSGPMPENLTGFVTEKIKEQFETMDIPPVGEFLEMIHDGGGKIFVCKAIADMFHLTKDDFCEEVDDIISVGKMYEASAGAQIIYT